MSNHPHREALHEMKSNWKKRLHKKKKTHGGEESSRDIEADPKLNIFKEEKFKEEKKPQFDLFEAITQCQEGKIREILLVNTEALLEDKFGWSPLHIAVQNGNKEIVQLLLNWGGNPNIENSINKMTPLHSACRIGSKEIVIQLIDRGAEPWRVDSSGKNVLFYLAKLAKSEEEIAVQILDYLFTNKKYEEHLYQQMISLMDSENNTIFTENTTKLFSDKLHEIKPKILPKSITIFIHGWNDRVEDWRDIVVPNFTQDSDQFFHLFSFNSLDDSVTIPALTGELRLFISKKIKENTDKNNGESLKINLICYSTGAMIVRAFLNTYYHKEFKGRITRVIMFAPANFGSPWGRAGKSKKGRIYAGHMKKLKFEVGKELLTNLEVDSPFLWSLCHSDALADPEKQYFKPSEIMLTIIQGTRHYGDRMSRITKGDMTGTDGTVTISGAGLRIVKYSINLSEKDKLHIDYSTHSSLLRLHPSYNHYTIIDSLIDKGELFYLTKRLLEIDESHFLKLQSEFEVLNQIKCVSPIHVPANLLVFRYEGLKMPLLTPMIFYHPSDVPVTLGQRPLLNQMTLYSDPNPISERIRELFVISKMHSRSVSNAFKLINLQLVSELLIELSKQLNQCISLSLSINSELTIGRIFASTKWTENNGNCFPHMQLDTTILISLTAAKKLNKSKEPHPFKYYNLNLMQILKDPHPNIPMLLNLIDDNLFHENLSQIGMEGLSQIWQIFLNTTDEQQSFLDAIKKKVTGYSIISKIYCLKTFSQSFDVSPHASELCAYFIYKLSGEYMHQLKTLFAEDSSQKDEFFSLITGLRQVPIEILIPERKNGDISDEYVTQKDGIEYIDTKKWVIDLINEKNSVVGTSLASFHERDMKKEAMITFLFENTIYSEGSEDDQEIQFFKGQFFPTAPSILKAISTHAPVTIFIKHANIQKIDPSFPINYIFYEDRDNFTELYLDFLKVNSDISHTIILPPSFPYQNLENPINHPLSVYVLTHSYELGEKLTSSTINIGKDLNVTLLNLAFIFYDEKLINLRTIVDIFGDYLREILNLSYNNSEFISKYWEVANYYYPILSKLIESVIPSMRSHHFATLIENKHKHEIIIRRQLLLSSLTNDGVDFLLQLKEKKVSGGDFKKFAKEKKIFISSSS